MDIGNKDSWDWNSVMCIVGLLPKSPWRFDRRDLAVITRVKSENSRASATAHVAVAMAWLVYGVAR